MDISDCFLRNQNNMIYLMSNHNNNLVITHEYVKIIQKFCYDYNFYLSYEDKNKIV